MNFLKYIFLFYHKVLCLSNRLCIFLNSPRKKFLPYSGASILPLRHRRNDCKNFSSRLLPARYILSPLSKKFYLMLSLRNAWKSLFRCSIFPLPHILKKSDMPPCSTHFFFAHIFHEKQIRSFSTPLGVCMKFTVR